MSLCLSPHPLDAGVVCLEPAGAHDEHAFGREPGMAVWRDGEMGWRYVPYASQEQYDRLHGLEATCP